MSEIDAQWTALTAHVAGTALSATRPILGATGRAIQAFNSQGMRSLLAAQTRHNRKYILETDISRFYHSVYTHSIPWAIHTKSFAKSNRGMAHIGNRLDLLIRAAQDQQTIGIPIGPDTSLFISEILMQACDRKLLAAVPGLRGHHYLDDYQLGFRTRTEAEEAYHLLSSVLSEYELALNLAKTRIVELPSPLEPTWRQPVTRYEFRSGLQRRQEAELLSISTSYST